MRWDRRRRGISREDEEVVFGCTTILARERKKAGGRTFWKLVKDGQRRIVASEEDLRWDVMERT